MKETKVLKKNRFKSTVKDFQDCVGVLIKKFQVKWCLIICMTYKKNKKNVLYSPHNEN